jgi:hypothetical protein
VSHPAPSMGHMAALVLAALEAFIVRAKAATYVGAGEEAPSSRPGSHDLSYVSGSFAYFDSYVGGSDFLGQELVTFVGKPAWAMNYYGYLLRPDLIDAARAGAVIKESLAALYRQGRFLGGHVYTVGEDVYTDTNAGDLSRFTGTEWITRHGERLYQLAYEGGLVKE